MPPFHIQYRCFFRDYWYDDENEIYSLPAALSMCIALELASGRRTRVVDEYGRIVFPPEEKAAP
jgi:hypothetical protein